MDSRVREAIWSLEEQQASSQGRRRGALPSGSEDSMWGVVAGADGMVVLGGTVPV